MAKTVVGSFNSYADAQQVVEELQDSGVARDDISIVANDATGEHSRTPGTTGEKASDTASAAGKGAVAGGVLGGAAGLAAGLAGLAIPGIGPIIAAGPIVAALTGAGVGAAAGGLIGGLTHVGVPEEDAGYYAEAVRRGGALVTVRADDDLADRVADIMNSHDAIDVDEKAESWRKSGWKRFDETAQPLTAADIDRERVTVSPAATEQMQARAREAERRGVRTFDYMTDDSMDIGQAGAARTTAEAEYRDHFQSTYGTSGARFDEYAPAYQYGSTLRDRYAGRDWTDIEPDVRRDWERSNPGRAWDRFKAAIRHAWDSATGGTGREVREDVGTRRPLTR